MLFAARRGGIRLGQSIGVSEAEQDHDESPNQGLSIFRQPFPYSKSICAAGAAKAASKGPVAKLSRTADQLQIAASTKPLVAAGRMVIDAMCCYFAADTIRGGGGFAPDPGQQLEWLSVERSVRGGKAADPPDIRALPGLDHAFPIAI
ncbi:hypothetical protein J6500_30060 [Bradyrhizobium sp. WSM 1704]|uniref:hypothetical protein n=1 Tax=Bradyrhizobium semiaridum TaxID=2821404 RepID=UPI001CE2EA8D|nr:hypothetical protein [Bradyrhizobium semiaridum]MCA6126105.1 hypothetical protein [Bradyrhizobium semiaridum]